MKMHLNLATRDLDASVAFYSILLAAAPAKTLPCRVRPEKPLVNF